MDADQSAKLSRPFTREQIGLLPKPTKKENQKGKCKLCDGWHGLPAVHLDYVGHAQVTARLNEVDPDWTWEPYALDPEGLPKLDRFGGLWIRLTIAGVTRPGYGDSDGSSVAGPKVLIGDALRNGAMRFGVALDLWSKQDLHEVKDDQAVRYEDRPSQSTEPPPPADNRVDEQGELMVTAVQGERIVALFDELGTPKADRLARVRAITRIDTLPNAYGLTSTQAGDVITALQDQADMASRSEPAERVPASDGPAAEETIWTTDANGKVR